MGYTVWTNSLTVAYKTRPLFHPQRGLIEGRVEEFVEDTAYWFEPEAIASGLSAEQAEGVQAYLERISELPPRLLGSDATQKTRAKFLALTRREDVVLRFFWTLPDGEQPVEGTMWKEYAGAV